MAFYKYGNFLKQNQHANFDKIYSPGDSAPDAGVYRCTVCMHEIGIAKTHTLPPQGHHAHSYGAGPIRWQLIVGAEN